MYVSEEQLDERVKNNSPVLPEVVIQPLNLGKLGLVDYSMQQRIHAVVLQRIMGTKAAAEVTGMVPQRIASVYGKGMVSQGGPIVKELVSGIEAKTGEIRDAAAAHVLLALGAITPEEISGSKMKDKIHVADRLSAIVERMANGAVKSPGGPAVQVNIYAPRIREESEYEILEAKG